MIKVTSDNIGELLIKSAEQALQITKEIDKGLRLDDGSCISCASVNDPEFWCYYGCPKCVCGKNEAKHR